jgi:hypothetical protein
MDLLMQVRDAKQRIAIALEIRDKLYHEKSLDAVGSTQTLKLLSRTVQAKARLSKTHNVVC